MQIFPGPSIIYIVDPERESVGYEDRMWVSEVVACE